MNRWLVLGAGGMLALDLVDTLVDDDVIALGRAELDITDPGAVRQAVQAIRPDVVANCAAWTAVDAAEHDEAAAFAVNAAGAANIARACAASTARLVHFSTDYVFDGLASSPYPENADLAPRSAYGRTKAAGEWAVRALLPSRSWVVRTAWLYGAGGSNFVKTMIRLESTRDVIDVVDDQRGQPTWSADVAWQVVRLAESDAPAGVYHATASGETTWWGLARAVFQELGADVSRVRATTTARSPRPARRPAYSVLGHDAWAAARLPTLPPWRQSLSRALDAFRSVS
jgi:dTDP-4-dehydrorhamnose reductase